MKPARARSLLLLVMLLLSAAAVLGYHADSLLNDLLRPRLETWGGRLLNAPLRIDRLELGRDFLRIQGLRLSREQAFDVHLPHADIRFSFAGLLRSHIDSLALVDPRVQVMNAAVPSSDENETSSPFLSRPLPVTFGNIQLKKGELEYRQPQRAYIVSDLDFTVDEHPQGYELELSARIGQGEGLSVRLGGFCSAAPPWSLRLDRLDLQDQSLLDEPLNISLGPSTASGGGALVLESLDEQKLARWLTPLDIKLSLPEGVRFTMKKLRISLRLQGESLAATLGLAQADLASSGLAVALGEVQADIEGQPGRWTGRAQWTGRKAISSQKEMALNLAGLGGDFTATTEAEKLVVAAQIQRKGRALLKLQGDGSVWRIALSPGPWKGIVQVLPPRTMPPSLLGAEGLSGEFKAWQDAGAWRVEGDLRAGSLRLEGASFSDLRLRTRARLQKQGWVLEGYSLKTGIALGKTAKARVQSQGKGALEAGRYRFDLEKCALRDFEYLATDGTSGLTGGHFEGRAGISGTLGKDPVGVDLSATFGASEILKGAFYASLAQMPGTLALKGHWVATPGRFDLRELAADVKGLGDLRFTGTVEKTLLRLEGRARLRDFGSPFFTALRDALAQESPALGSLRASGGLDIEGHLVSGPKGLRAAGELRPKALSLSLGETGTGVSGFGGALPFDFALGELTPWGKAEGVRQGALSFGEVVMGPARLDGKTLNFSCAPNRLSLSRPAGIALAGGRILVDNLVFELLRDLPFAGARVRVEEIDLEQLTNELGITPMAGRLTADLGEIEYETGVIRSDGQARIEVFGGALEIGSMLIESPFGRYPVLSADVDFRGIDLNRLTRTFSFGEMNGVVDGYIHDLRLFGKTPSDFSARLQTREKGKRNISVKALNNLAVLSQGGLSAALGRGFYKFIDFYRYSKIGLECNLKNDVFRVRGTAREDSEKYLVYGGFNLPRIDILVSRPTISFKEMVKRLGRIDRAGH